MKRAALLALTLLAAACSSTQQPQPAPPPPPPAPVAPAPAPEPTPPPAAPAAVETPEESFRKALAGLGEKSVFFEFDKAQIKPDQVSVISDNAKLASSHAHDYVTLQGNCDERGSSEYNLALGQRRADAVKQRMTLLGIPESRIETISLGKEKPRATCHKESCWAQNRRVDFVHNWK